MSALRLSVGMALLFGVGVLVAQEGTIHIYYYNGSGYTKTGTMPSGQSSSMAIVCKNGNCRVREVCESCHTGSVASGPYANQALHDREFARQAMRLGDRPVPFGAVAVHRGVTGLVLARPTGERAAALPADALVLPDRSGTAAFILYRGDAAPRP
jgi:hypothetical protein